MPSDQSKSSWTDSHSAVPATAMPATMKAATMKATAMEGIMENTMGGIVEAATMEAVMKATMKAIMEGIMEAIMKAVMEMVVPETVAVVEMMEAILEEDRASSKKSWTVDPRVFPIVGIGIRRGIDRLRRQRVDLRGQTGCVLGDFPTTVRLLACLPNSLLLLSFDRHRRGELAAV